MTNQPCRSDPGLKSAVPQCCIRALECPPPDSPKWRARIDSAVLSINLAERGGQPRSRSTCSSPLRKQHTSSATPASCGSSAPTAASTRALASTAKSEMSRTALLCPPKPAPMPQLAEIRGCKPARSKSQRAFRRPQSWHLQAKACRGGPCGHAAGPVAIHVR